MEDKKYKTYYDGVNANYDELVKLAIKEISEMGALTYGQVKRLALRAIVYEDKSTQHLYVGWTPTQLGYITLWFSGSYIQSLCANNKIDFVNCGQDVHYKIITLKGFKELYEKYLNKVHRKEN